MTYSSRVFVIAAVLVLLALASYGSAFDVESLLRTAEQKEAYRLVTEYNMEDFEGTCNKTLCDVPAGNSNCTYQTEEGNSTVTHVCTGFNFCNSSSYCVAKYPEGHECTGAGECELSSVFVQPECNLNDTLGEYVCEQPIPHGWVGDECTADEDCYSNMCNTTAKVCEGFASGEPCNATKECDRGLYCHSGSCAAVLDYNATCSHDDECGMAWNGTACMGGHCLTPFSGAEGDSCSATSGMAGSCAAGLYCTGSVCKKWENIECDLANETSCDSLPGTTCGCNQFDGKSFCVPQSSVFTENAVKYFNEGVQCAKDHSCALEGTSGCFTQNCGDDLECFAYEFFKSAPASCLGLDLKCNKGGGSSSEQPSHSDASRTTAAVVITALAAVAALL